jgi:hypothetical protein
MKSMYLPLLPGAESRERMLALLSIKSKMGARHKAAILDVYVLGWPVNMAARHHGLEPENLSRNITKLDELCRLIHKFNIS